MFQYNSPFSKIITVHGSTSRNINIIFPKMDHILFLLQFSTLRGCRWIFSQPFVFYLGRLHRQIVSNMLSVISLVNSFQPTNETFALKINRKLSVSHLQTVAWGWNIEISEITSNLIYDKFWYVKYDQIVFKLL